MRPPKLIPAQVSFSVHFMETAIPGLDEASQRLQRRAMESIQTHAWGDRHREFARLMQSAAFQPMIPLDPVFFVPVADGLRAVAMNAVKAWNRCKFPLRFKEGPEFLQGPAKLVAPTPAARMSRAGMEMDAEGAPDPWTCVVWEWRNGEYVPTYNYRVAPDGDPTGSPAPRSRSRAMDGMDMDHEEALPGVFHDIMPGFDLMAVYELHIGLRLAFPLPDASPLRPPAEKVSLAPRPSRAKKATPVKKATRGARKTAKRVAK